MSSTDIQNNPTGCCPGAAEPVEQDSADVITELDFLVNKETNSQNRLLICKTCPELITPINVCKQCGCLMNIKTRIFSSHCPLDKW
jgi:hypothetical protein